MATAYLLQKMRKAQDDLRENIAAQKEARLKKENETSSFWKDNKSSDDNRTNDKRNNVKNTIDDGEFNVKNETKKLRQNCWQKLLAN